MVGIGDEFYTLAVYIGNRPPIEEYQTREELIPAVEGELLRIGQETGNHWRKIFNIYAKLAFNLNSEGYLSWQSYRDGFLLTKNSRQVMLFDDKVVNKTQKCISIISGKGYAMTFLEASNFVWLDSEFAIDTSNRIIVTPYFDYRQLSDVKIEKLVRIIRGC
jgi:hypothetical protein